jgi:hypothetical protein
MAEEEDLQALAPPPLEQYLGMTDEEFEAYLERAKQHIELLVRRALSPERSGPELEQGGR